MARPRGANRRRFVLALLVLTSLTLITLDSRSGRSGPLGAVGRIAHDVVSPIERATNAAAGPIGDWWSGVIDSGQLKRENRSLRAQVAELKGKQQQAVVALNENTVLHAVLGLAQTLSRGHPVPARVVNVDPGNFESTITIDRGQEAGIEKGMAVAAPDGVVGHVIASWHGGADVRLLTDPESAIAVRTLEHPGVGIAQGEVGSRDLVASDFETSAHVKKGDTVVTADVANSLYPPDLTVGTVTGVDTQPAGLGLVVRIAPSVDFDGLDFVVVLRWVPGEGPVVPITTTTTTTTTPATATSTTFGSSSSSTTTSSSTSTSSTTASTPTSGSGG
jgi:rod shape-determining protein MreC